MDNVLGSARTGLIFTRIQEGAQSGQADPTPNWPNRAGYSIPCAVMLGSGGGELGGRELTLGSGARVGSRGGRLCGLCSLCCVFSFSVLLLFLFPLFAVLLNCPYPNPPVSASFFPFSPASRRGEGQPRGAFVAGGSQTITGALLGALQDSVKPCSNTQIGTQGRLRLNPSVILKSFSAFLLSIHPTAEQS